MNTAKLITLGLLRGSGAETFSERLLSKFPGGDEVVVMPSFATAPNYTMVFLQAIGSGKYAMTYWTYAATVGANGSLMYREDVVDVYRMIDDISTPALSFSGGTWTTSSSNWSKYMRNTTGTAGAYAQFTTSDSVTSVGCLVPAGLTNGMMHVISIDGDSTLADLLPTAQSLVDGGSLDAAALVSGGGTLNPTDRILDTYNRSAPAVPFNYAPLSIFTRTLSPGQHTVRVTITPYKNTASSGGWYAFGSLLEYGESIPNITAGGAKVLPVANMQVSPAQRVNEISYNIKPTGASSSEWLGHANSFKWAEAPTISVDGTPITPTAGVAVAGSTISVTVHYNVRHSYTGATNIGTWDVIYTFDKLTGVTVSYTLTWATTGVMVSYACMLQVLHATMDRFATEDYPTGADLTDNNDAFKLPSDKQVAYCWDYDGNAAALLYIPDLAETVNNWAETVDNKIAWADVAVATWKKAYITRISPERAFADGEVLTAATNYRIGWFPDGANTALST